MESKRVEPFTRFFAPHILFEFDLDFGAEHFLGSISAYVQVCIDEQGSGASGLGPAYLNPDQPYPFFSQPKRHFQFLLQLSREMIEFIDDFRFKNPHRDVYFLLTMRSRSIMVGGELTKYPQERENVLALPVRGSPWQQEKNVPGAFYVSDSDWVNKFKQKFKLGRWLLLEVPVDISELAERAKRVANRMMAERMEKVAEKLADGEQKLRAGEWTECVRLSRDALEIIRKGTIEVEGEVVSMDQLVKNVIRDAGLAERAQQAVPQLIDQLYNFASATHPIDRQGRKIEISGFQKEDALLSYGCVALILHMLTRKLMTTTR
jgi:hypothetical protein